MSNRIKEVFLTLKDMLFVYFVMMGCIYLGLAIIGNATGKEFVSYRFLSTMAWILGIYVAILFISFSDLVVKTRKTFGRYLIYFLLSIFGIEGFTIYKSIQDSGKPFTYIFGNAMFYIFMFLTAGVWFIYSKKEEKNYNKYLQIYQNNLK